MSGDYPGNTRKRQVALTVERLEPETTTLALVEANENGGEADPSAIRPALAQLAASNLDALQRALLDAALSAATTRWATVACGGCGAPLACGASGSGRSGSVAGDRDASRPGAGQARPGGRASCSASALERGCGARWAGTTSKALPGRSSWTSSRPFSVAAARRSCGSGSVLSRRTSGMCCVTRCASSPRRRLHKSRACPNHSSYGIERFAIRARGKRWEAAVLGRARPLSVGARTSTLPFDTAQSCGTRPRAGRFLARLGGRR
jgi:hypothetical protein